MIKIRGIIIIVFRFPFLTISDGTDFELEPIGHMHSLDADAADFGGADDSARLLPRDTAGDGCKSASTVPSIVYLLTAFSALGGLLFGYDTGVISGAMLLIAPHFRLSSVMQVRTQTLFALSFVRSGLF